MELREFISETLGQIIDGVRSAQANEGGEAINAKAWSDNPGGNLVFTGKYGLFTRVDFDVAVSAETSGGGAAKLTVFGVGFEGEGQKTASSANRVTFSVPVRLPDGDTSVAEAVAEQIRENREQLAEARKKRFRGS
ncbi:hypothetical protein [Oricola sp.]|uniref:hypothetical protein n=1 Tax=Oricola sp. TaxID=1979950 RepID=UPI0025F59ABA|nr:hypothetical protein [Oricola sp.]MCI5078245.1 hypothetical protein [Oricola sp.]